MDNIHFNIFLKYIKILTYGVVGWKTFFMECVLAMEYYYVAGISQICKITIQNVNFSICYTLEINTMFNTMLIFPLCLFLNARMA